MSAGSDIWIGIDLGTQSVRALAVTSDGEVRSSGQAPLASERRDTRHEQNPDEWWSALGLACRAAMSGLRPTDCVRALSVCGTSGTVLLVDAQGKALTVGLMYDDGRAADEAERANALGRPLWTRLGYGTIQRVWGLPKWMWLASRHKDQPAYLAQQADYITGRLAGRRTAADLSNALKSGCDTIEGRWNTALMESLGLAPDRLPGLVRPGTQVGTVDRSAAAHTAIPEGVAIIAGMTDGCASQLASGAAAAGSWNSVLGTTLVMKGKSPSLIHDPGGVVYSHRSPDGDWLPGGASSAGAGAFVRALGSDADLGSLSHKAAQSRERPAIVYPLASGRGERFPFIAADVTLALPDTLTGDPVQTYRSLSHGIAAVERLCFDYLQATGFPINGQISLTGGGIKSAYLSGLRATMLNRQLVVPAIAEPALGMALLASTIEHSLSNASRDMVRIAQRIDPDPAHRAEADDYYTAFVDDLRAKGWLAPTLADQAHGHVKA
ncbi:MAG TPA: FGGY family carbohydrate kinase [Nitrobacter sp.]|nr:FGGY family carbohydrate kinase [Nitrobacter sp.]